MMWLLRDTESKGNVFYRNVDRGDLVWTGIPDRAAMFLHLDAAEYVAQDIRIEHGIELVPVRWFDVCESIEKFDDQLNIARTALLIAESYTRKRFWFGKNALGQRKL